MWERLGGWFRLLWDAGEKFNQHSTAIDELQKSNQQLVQAIEYLLERNRRREDEVEQRLRQESEKRADELEKIELRLRLQISEELRRLPSKDE